MFLGVNGGECEDSIYLLNILKRLQSALRCVFNQKAAPQATAMKKSYQASFTKRMGIPVCYLSVLSRGQSPVKNCLFVCLFVLHFLQSFGTHEHVGPICPGWNLQILRCQMSVYDPFWEIPVTQFEAEGECRDGTHQPPSLQSVSVGPWMCVKLNACP